MISCQCRIARYALTNAKRSLLHLAEVSRKSLIYWGVMAPAVGAGASQQTPLKSKENFLRVRIESGGVLTDVP